MRGALSGLQSADAAAKIYPITSSAMETSVAGMATPRTLAVVRLQIGLMTAK
jgi:hypothetical protein